MHRIDSATASTDENGSGKDGFTGGDPSSGVSPTDLTADWFNDFQENICQFIESTGITLSKDDFDQLRDAIEKRIDTYRTAVSRSVPVPIEYAVPRSSDWTFATGGTARPDWESATNNGELWLPLRLPTGAVLNSLEGRFDGGVSWEVYRMDNVDSLGPGTVPEGTSLGSSTAGSTVDSITGISETIDNEDHYYVVIFTASGTGGSTPEHLTALRMTYDDPGPRNY